MSGAQVSLTDARNAGALPWAYGTIRNRAANLPWLVRKGRELWVDVQAAAAWLRAQGWSNCADRMLALATAASNQGGAASR